MTSATGPGPAAFEAAFDKIAARFPGAISAGYLAGDQTPLIRASGPCRVGGDTPVAPDAAWHIGSITKTFTATLLAQMSEAGALSLDAPLADLLPGTALHPDWQSLTLTEILSHQAGLRPNFTARQMLAAHDGSLTEQRGALLATQWTQPLPHRRGKYRYSNIGYVLGGWLAEQITGQPWEALVQARITAPLGLTSAGFGPPKEPDAPWGTKGFWRKRPAPPDDAGSDNPPWLGPAGTMHLTVADLLRWGQAHIRATRGDIPEFLGPKAAANMHSPHARDYGLGWEVTGFRIKRTTLPIHGHSGSNSMWMAHLFYSQEQDKVLALVMNRAGYLRSLRMLYALGKTVLG